MNAILDSVVVSSDLCSLSDEELISEYRASKNESYFTEIVRRYRPALARYLRGRYDFDANDLEDALQTAFLRVWEKLDQYDASRSFRPWIYRIATSQAIDLLRRTKRRFALVSLDAPRLSDDSSWSNELEGADPDPSEKVEQRDTERQIRAATRSLPSRYRDVVEMVFYRGMSRQHVARVLNLAAATVSRRVGKAVEMIGSSLLDTRLDASCNRVLDLVDHCESI